MRILNVLAILMIMALASGQAQAQGTKETPTTTTTTRDPAPPATSRWKVRGGRFWRVQRLPVPSRLPAEPTR